ncbi:MAG: amidohydrolase family protein [Candidatus Heimdallarchaeota archaeon]|nr:amidohydrolase family protein [Candidatus Heimdallarchaeota archaeon]
MIPELTIIRGIITNPHEIIKDGAIVIQGDTIIAKGPFTQIVQDYDSNNIVGHKNAIIMPGFVNTHSHAVQTFFRGAGDDKELLDWLGDVILPGEATLKADEVYASSRIGYAEMLLSGITTTNDMLTGNHAAQGLKAAVDSGIRGRVGKMLMDRNVPEPMLGDTEEVLNEAHSLAEQYPKGNHIQFSFTPRFIITCTDDLMRLSSDAAKEHQLMFHTHAAENRAEGKTVKELTGKSYIHAMDHLHGLGEHAILAHCVWTDESEQQLLKTTNTRISHNPSSNSKLASGIAPVHDYLEMGLKVGLATDGSPATGGHDFFLEMRLATFLQKARLKNPMALPAPKVFEMATIGGAQALNLDNVGLLQPGYKADITVLNPRLPNAFPMYNPYSYIVYTASPRDVSDVFVAGVHKVKNYQLMDDLSKYYSMATAYAEDKPFITRI